MKLRHSLLVLAFVASTALTACADAPSPQASSSSEAPELTTPNGEKVPAKFVAVAVESFPEMDPVTVYESAQFYCLTLTNISGDQDEAAYLLINDIGLTTQQAKEFMPLAIEFVCPEWTDEYDSWVADGGPGHL